MSENPRDDRAAEAEGGPPGIKIMTDRGLYTQPYLPGCAPEEGEGEVRPAVHRFAVLLRSMLRHYPMTLDEAVWAIRQCFREGEHP